MAPLAAALIGVALLVLFGLGELGHSAVNRAKAQATADMAALAGVYEGREGAVDLARRNGGVVLGYDDSDGRVAVRVRVGTVEASAKAEWVSEPVAEAAPG
ncbi:MAG: pilus assembly protein TadG-related protein [Acidimicrobiia bacterium]|nr:pilus assembly protein TadG-related protein [Acidimicrobiia bacterium]MDH5290419.1 pilus assembly protein TadG-related protein [Acidimicrobiia bacterium]